MAVRDALRSQYHAALAMVRRAIERCPDEVWVDEEPVNAFWHLAYHALFYGHLYLMPDEASFTAWEKHRENHQFLGRLPWPPHDPVELGEPYSRDDLLAYCDHVDGLVDATLEEVDLDAESCGFWWYDLPKLDHEILSIRHVQHHAGQLADRLRSRAGVGVDWATR
jgi:hypothetical protein